MTVPNMTQMSPQQRRRGMMEPQDDLGGSGSPDEMDARQQEAEPPAPGGGGGIPQLRNPVTGGTDPSASGKVPLPEDDPRHGLYSYLLQQRNRRRDAPALPGYAELEGQGRANADHKRLSGLAIGLQDAASMAGTLGGKRSDLGQLPAAARMIDEGRDDDLANKYRSIGQRSRDVQEEGGIYRSLAGTDALYAKLRQQRDSRQQRDPSSVYKVVPGAVDPETGQVVMANPNGDVKVINAKFRPKSAGKGEKDVEEQRRYKEAQEAEQRRYKEAQEREQRAYDENRRKSEQDTKAQEKRTEYEDSTRVDGIVVKDGFKPTADDAKKVKAAKIAYDAIRQNLAEMDAIYKRSGTNLVGDDANRMESLETATLMKQKELDALGVLQGRDEILELKQVPTASTVTENLKGIFGLDSYVAKSEQYRKNLENQFNSTIGGHGYSRQDATSAPAGGGGARGVLMKSPTGKSYRVPPDKVEEAKKKGWK